MAIAERFDRLELKYHVSSALAAQIRRAIAPWCRPDPFNGTCGYPISSLYLDTPGLLCHHARMRGDADRFKLRVRTYSTDDPAHLEIKRKTGKIIHKVRTSIAREQLPEVMRRGLPGNAVADRFVALAQQCGAGPRLTVCYHREAYTSVVDDYARVTFDRQIKAAAAAPGDWALRCVDEGDGWVSLDGAGHLADGVSSTIVLELKCKTFVPRWMESLLRHFNLRSTGFSKYSQGVAACGLGASQRLTTWRP